MIVDMQSAIVAALIARLAQVPDFGGLVMEGGVFAILDAEDQTLPDDFIVIQPGATEEVERQVPASVRERVTLNVTAITRRRQSAPALRAARLAIKVALPGTKASIEVQGVQQASFQPETPMPPGEGRRWACHVMPLAVTYVQSLK